MTIYTELAFIALYLQVSRLCPSSGIIS